MPNSSKNGKKKQSKQNHHLLTIGWIVVSVCIAIELSIALIDNPTITANFADTIMRPMIGSQNTISIEAFFFAVADNVDRIKYAYVKPDLGTLTPDTGIAPAETKEATFTLQDIPPLAHFAPLAGEGQWNVIKTASSDAVLAETIYRPDPQRDYAIAYIVKMNMDHLTINAVAGYREPGGSTNPGPGKIPITSQKTNAIVAAFNGGFQQKDGHYGMIVGDKTYLPLQTNLATLIMYGHAKPQIVNYTGQYLGSDVIAIRQNGPMLLLNSVDVSSSSAWTMQTWGLTTTNSMYTWRSGLGVTKNGNLVYVAGPSLVPETLAAALKAAGAVNGMQLDINPVWVRFTIFDPLGNGKYAYHALTNTMQNGGYAYLYGYQKDFFYLTEK